MTMHDIEPLYPPSQESPTRRLTNRIGRAWRDGGIGHIAAEARQMVLWRLNRWLLDRLLSAHESRKMAETTHLDALTIDSKHRAHGVFYTPTPALVARIIHTLCPGRHADWNFVDIGAGRGRVVGQAARHPYREVIGIEFAAELVADAKRHLDSLDHRGTRAQSINILQADATSFDVPAGPTLYFLFNPFSLEVMTKFIDHICEQAKANGAPARVLYYHPEFAALFDGDSRFREARLPLPARGLIGLLSPYDLKIFDLN